jgi:hypothetical protein
MYTAISTQHRSRRTGKCNIFISGQVKGHHIPTLKTKSFFKHKNATCQIMQLNQLFNTFMQTAKLSLVMHHTADFVCDMTGGVLAMGIPGVLHQQPQMAPSLMS